MADQTTIPEKRIIPAQEITPSSLERKFSIESSSEPPVQSPSETVPPRAIIEYPVVGAPRDTAETSPIEFDRASKHEVTERVTHLFLWHKIGDLSCGEAYANLDEHHQKKFRAMSNPLRDRIIDLILNHAHFSSARESETTFFYLLTEGNALRDVFHALFPDVKKAYLEQELKCFAEEISEQIYPELYASNDNAIAA